MLVSSSSSLVPTQVPTHHNEEVFLELSVEFGESFARLFRELPSLLERTSLSFSSVPVSSVPLDTAEVFSGSFDISVESYSQVQREQVDPGRLVSFLISSFSQLGEDERVARETLRKIEQARTLFTKKLEEASRKRVFLEALKLHTFNSYREIQEVFQIAQLVFAESDRLKELADSCISIQGQIVSSEQSLRVLVQEVFSKSLPSSASASVPEVSPALVTQEAVIPLVPALVTQDLVISPVPALNTQDLVISPVPPALVSVPEVSSALDTQEVVILPVLEYVPEVSPALVTQDLVISPVPALVTQEVVIPPVPALVTQDLVIPPALVSVPEVSPALGTQEASATDSNDLYEDLLYPDLEVKSLLSQEEEDRAAFKLFKSNGCNSTKTAKQLGMSRVKFEATLSRARSLLTRQSN